MRSRRRSQYPYAIISFYSCVYIYFVIIIIDERAIDDIGLREKAAQLKHRVETRRDLLPPTLEYCKITRG